MKKRNIVGFFICVALIAFALVLFFLNQKKHSHDEKKVVQIGAVLPMTGNLSSIGESASHGLRMAEEYVNTYYPDRQLKILIEDGMGNTASSISAANKLVTIDKISTIFSIVSSVDLALIPIHQKQGTLMFSHASHPSLSAVDSLFFRHSQTVTQEVSFVLDNVDTTSNFALCYMNDDFGVAFCSALKNSLGNEKLISEFPFPANETNFQTLAKKVIDSRAEKIIICAGGKNISNLIIKLREQNYQGEIVTTLSYVVSGAGALTQNIHNLSMVNFKKAELAGDFASFVQDYEKRNGCRIGTAELIFFNSAMIVYLNSMNGITPLSVAEDIKKQSELDILGNRVVITTTNDILPELIMERQL